MMYYMVQWMIYLVPSMFSLGGQLVVATGYGVLHRLTWEGKLIGPMRIHLDKLPFANDSLATTKGLLM